MLIVDLWVVNTDDLLFAIFQGTISDVDVLFNKFNQSFEGSIQYFSVQPDGHRLPVSEKENSINQLN